MCSKFHQKTVFCGSGMCTHDSSSALQWYRSAKTAAPMRSVTDRQRCCKTGEGSQVSFNITLLQKYTIVNANILPKTNRWLCQESPWTIYVAKGIWKAARSRNKVTKLAARVWLSCRCLSYLAALARATLKPHSKVVQLPVPILSKQSWLQHCVRFHGIEIILSNPNCVHCIYICNV